MKSPSTSRKEKHAMDDDYAYDTIYDGYYGDGEDEYPRDCEG